MNSTRPIPEFLDPDSQMVKIQECGEPVAPLHLSDRIRIFPAYFARGFANAESSIRLRTGAIDALHAASVTLPKGISLVVYDGLRSVQMQKEIAHRFAATLFHIPMSQEERTAVISRFVAPLPATEEDYRAAPPAHCTGAAVDVGLAEDSGLVDLGADFDQFDEIAETTYFERLCRISRSQSDLLIRNRRRILYWAMIEAGFAPYPAEYWHFEFGTKRAAAFHGHTVAKYGAISPWPRVAEQLRGALV